MTLSARFCSISRPSTSGPLHPRIGVPSRPSPKRMLSPTHPRLPFVQSSVVRTCLNSGNVGLVGRDSAAAQRVVIGSTHFGSVERRSTGRGVDSRGRTSLILSSSARMSLCGRYGPRKDLLPLMGRSTSFAVVQARMVL